jgi:hypothetical protein
VEQFLGRCVDDAVDGAEEGGPGFVVEDDDDTGRREAPRVVPEPVFKLNLSLRIVLTF